MATTILKVPIKEVRRFMRACLEAVGCEQKPATEMAELLLAADRFGHPSHGLNRLENYLNDVKAGVCNPNNKPEVVSRCTSTAVVDVKNVLGASGAYFCMDLAIEIAHKTGVGWVVARGANHYGMAGWWGLHAAKHGCIGMTFSNTSPYMAPTRSKKAALGTNPLAIIAPGSDGEFFYLEMATTAVAVGMLELKRRVGQPLPTGWAQGPDGKETTDAELGIKTRCLMPLGGSEENRGYKGYGLATMVELFAGISSGSNFGHKIRSWGVKTAGPPKPANLGQCYVALDVKGFAQGFEARVTDMLRHLRNIEPTDPKRPVLAPGDIEWVKLREYDKLGTLPYSKQQIDASAALAKKLNIKPLEISQ